MIPHSPLLLVTAVHALARHGARLSRVRRSIPCSLDFVLCVGETAHFDLRVGLSSWPVSPVSSFESLRLMARRHGWERSRAEAGDLIVFRDSERRGAQVVGVVMAIVGKRLSRYGSVRCCAVAWATSGGKGRMRIVTGIRMGDTRGGDLIIRWYATTDDIERAA